MKATGQILTFYSYKGGVGRSMGLANVAALLAKWRRRVLVVDWDLEAPGIEAYFNARDLNLSDQRRDTPGVIDLISAIKEGQQLDWKDCLLSARPFSEGEVLQIISSGMNDGSYKSRVQNTDWNALFETKELGTYIESLRNSWKKEYDFILIDSRTGITDIGGVCTIHLPDYLLTWFTTTQTSIAGARDVAELATQAQDELPFDRNPLLVVPVPARDESREEVKLYGKWKEIIVKEFSNFYTKWLPPQTTPHEVVDKLRIPHIAYWSFGERLAVVEEGTTDISSLGWSYELLSRLIFFNLDWKGVENNPEHTIEYLSRAVGTDVRSFGPEYAELLFESALNSEGKRSTLATEAAELAKTAIDIWHQLAEIDLIIYGPKLAKARNFLSTLLREEEIADIQGSIVEATEAVNIYRRLYKVDQILYGEELASSLANLSNLLYESEDTVRAIEALREVIETQRELAAANPVRFEPDLAERLFSLSNYLIELTQFSGALAAAREAVEVYRHLSSISEGRYEPDLASALNTLGECLFEAGDSKGALATWQEAVGIFKRHAEKDPRRYLPDLTSSLNGLLDTISQLEVADGISNLVLVKEAVEIFRGLVQQDPKRYEMDLAKSLNLLPDLLTGKATIHEADLKEALESQEEAVEIFRRLTQTTPSLYEVELARSLISLARLLFKVENPKRARSVAEEALSIFKRLALPSSRRYKDEIDELSELLKE
jgi:MinD-like ATPase involved in chromosome partitioning or flagellar assembly